MSKKQNKSFYFICIFFLGWIGSIQSSSAQNVSSQLKAADSLFQKKKYTESFEIYQTIMNSQNQASARMLLKMAFIKEGLGDYSNALYFLDLYYLQTSDKKAQIKMKEIATEHELMGFELSDSDFFLGLLYKYYLPINLLLFALVLGLMVNIIIVKRKTNKRPVVQGVGFVLLLALLFYSINYAGVSNNGIIVQNHAYLMSGPSGGSDLVEVVKKGHRLKIYNQLGPWIEVDWNGTHVFVREAKIKKVG